MNILIYSPRNNEEKQHIIQRSNEDKNNYNNIKIYNVYIIKHWIEGTGWIR